MYVLKSVAGAALLAATGTLAGCGDAPVQTTFAQPTPSLQQVLSNNTVRGTQADGSPFCEYYSANGQLIGYDEGGTTFNWTVENEQLCIAGGGSFRSCKRVTVVGNRVAYFDAATGDMNAEGTMRPGNSC